MFYTVKYFSGVGPERHKNEKWTGVLPRPFPLPHLSPVFKIYLIMTVAYLTYMMNQSEYFYQVPKYVEEGKAIFLLWCW